MIVGAKAPEFALYDHAGGIRTLSGFLADGPVVMFFFPIASSPICTAQACHFRDLGGEFAELGVQRIGVSTDSVDRQARFAARRSFDYPLLSDIGGVLSDRFGVRRGALATARARWLRRQHARGPRHVRRRGLIARILPLRRTTFVIDTDRTVLKIIHHELRAHTHADAALKFLRENYAPPARPIVAAQRTDPADSPIVPAQRTEPADSPIVPAPPTDAAEPPVLPAQRTTSDAATATPSEHPAS